MIAVVVKSWRNSLNNNCNSNSNKKNNNMNNPHECHKDTNRARASLTTPIQPLPQASTYPSKSTTLTHINNSYCTNKNYNHSWQIHYSKWSVFTIVKERIFSWFWIMCVWRRHYRRVRLRSLLMLIWVETKGT